MTLEEKLVEMQGRLEKMEQVVGELQKPRSLTDGLLDRLMEQQQLQQTGKGTALGGTSGFLPVGMGELFGPGLRGVGSYAANPGGATSTTPEPLPETELVGPLPPKRRWWQRWPLYREQKVKVDYELSEDEVYPEEREDE